MHNLKEIHMKSFIVVLLASVSLFIMSSFSYGQGNEIRINRFLYQDSVLFEDSWVQSRRQLSEDRFLIDTVSYRNTVVLETPKDSLLIYLSERMSVHFISLHTSLKGNNLFSVRYVEPIGDCCPFFPSEILYHNLIRSGIFHIVIVFVEAEGPMFVLNIYEWDSVMNTVSIVYESGYYFAYPSWNPTIEREKIKVKDRKIHIPYCEGCESGVDGVLKWDILVYDDNYYMLLK